MLCYSCSSIRFEWFEELGEASRYAKDPINSVFDRINKYEKSSVETKFFIHQPSFGHLIQAKTLGCYICAALWFAFTQPSKHPNQGPLEAERVEITPSPPLDSDPSSNREIGWNKECPIIWSVFASRRPEYAAEVWSNLKENVYVYCGKFYRCFYAVDPPRGKQISLSDHGVLTTEGNMHEYLTESVSGGRLAAFSTLTTLHDLRLPLELAKLWYNECVTNHAICAALPDQSSKKPMLPKRVIDVKTPGQNPVLYEPTAGETGEYICLSHCWGATKPIHVTRDDATEVKLDCEARKVYQLPPISTWPQSFQDAVVVARQFDIRYLWIDNTSIKQGDHKDWATESQKMAQYFSNASLTLMPSWAADDDSGMFHARNPLLNCPLCLIPEPEKSSSGGYFVSLKGLDQVNEDETIRAPLFSRAWVLQEQQLSRRLLKFGVRGIHWQCFCMVATPARITPEEHLAYQHLQFGKGQPLKMHIYPSSSAARTNGGRNPYLDLWYATLTEFTTRNMKMKSDVLPAISGLAQAFAGYMNPSDRYIAGLWLSDLMLGLLWTAEVEGSREQPIPFGANYDPAGFSGPSWSWISQCHKPIRLHFRDRMLPGGKCDYLENNQLVGTQIMSAKIDYKPLSEPYGEVNSGRLYFRAKLPSIRISAARYALNPEDKNRRNMINEYSARTEVHLLTMDKAPFSAWVALFPIEGVRGREMLGECDIDDTNTALWRSHIRDGVVRATFLPLIMYKGDPDGLRAAGLVLLTTNTDDEFCRIGRAEVDIPNRRSLHLSSLPMREISVI